MSFAARERSPDRGEPISLVQFRYGTEVDDVFSYTDHEDIVPFADHDYQPVPIDIGEVTSSGSLDDAGMTISVSQTAGIVDLFRSRPASSLVTVVIRQGHVNDPDDQFIVGWSGKVTSFEVDGSDDIATFGCEPISTSMQRSMLRRHWQYGCPHALYGPQCRANRAASTVNRVALAVSGAHLTFDQGWETAARKPKYQGGIAEWRDQNGRREVRRILRCSPDGTVQLSDDVGDLAAGATLSLVLGCNHKTGIPALADDGDCAPLFNNILNFGGDPWIPLENPVGFKNNFY